MKTFGGVSPRVFRAAGATLALALGLGAGGCGRRGPPLAPLQVDPEPPRVLPLRQENGAVVVRWYAPRLDSRGDPADLRLRRAIVSYRIVDLHALAAEERASQRRPLEEVDEGKPGAAPSGDEDAAGIREPESPATEEEAAPDAPAPETGETAPGVATPVPDAGPPATSEPESEDQPPVVAPPREAPAPGTSGAAEEPAPAGGAPPEEAEPEQEPAPEGEGESEPEGGPDRDATQEAPGPGEPAPEEAGGETPEQAPDPEVEPEPEGTLLDYQDLEFEVLSEVESEVPGEERVLELPVEPDWIGHRLEITVRYEARGGASEASEPRSLDVTGPLPAVEGVLVEVGPRELTIHWQDPRGALGEATLADLLFEVFRRRGEESERLGRSFGPSRMDVDLVWGEEVCYRARLVVVGDAEERMIPDPGPVAPALEGDEGAGESPTPDQDAGEAPWTPIPLRVPGAGTGALSVGPMSAEECVTPVDVFSPVPPSDLRVFWRTEATELSWRDSASTDVSGYHVYRSRPDGAGLQRLTEAPVEQTSYTDAARDPRDAYRYAVTAVDGADPPNESLPSDPRTANPR